MFMASSSAPRMRSREPSCSLSEALWSSESGGTLESSDRVISSMVSPVRSASSRGVGLQPFSFSYCCPALRTRIAFSLISRETLTGPLSRMNRFISPAMTGTA